MEADSTNLVRLHAKQRDASHTLDDCAQLIRECSLGSVSENVRKMGEAIGKVGDIDQQGYGLDAGLLPAFFKIDEGHSGTSIEKAISKAYYSERDGQLQDAISGLREFLDTALALDEDALEIASAELTRLMRIQEARRRT